jgi:hypothetical protein
VSTRRVASDRAGAGQRPVSARGAAGGRAAELAVAAAIALWGLLPVVLMILHAALEHLRLTGADGLIGADQLQYMAWARDAGSHGLASDLFVLRPTGHVFLQPMFELSAALWRLGLPLQAAYLLWKPVAVAVLFWGALRWCRRLMPEPGPGRAAALMLALFLFTPAASLALWAGLLSPATRNQLGGLAGELFPAGELWGYLPSAIAVGLMPVALLASERAVRGGAFTGGGRGALAPKPRRRRRALGLAGACALAIAWLHPWQGVVLALILGGWVVWERGRGWRALSVPLVGVLLPLGYYLALSKLDWAWRLAATNEHVGRPGLTALALALAPPLVIAATGLRSPRGDLIERAVILWVPASLTAYALVGSYPTHALESISLPVAVLAVRGWRRISGRLAPGGRRAAFLPGVAVLALLALTIPGVAYDARALHRTAAGPEQNYYLSRSEARALDWVNSDAPAGGVLAPTLLATAIPAQTGRRVWVGHEFWSIDYPARSAFADALFAGRLPAALARRLVLLSGARLLVSSCLENANLAGALRPLRPAVHRFGCASVYVIPRTIHDPSRLVLTTGGLRRLPDRRCVGCQSTVLARCVASARCRSLCASSARPPGCAGACAVRGRRGTSSVGCALSPSTRRAVRSPTSAGCGGLTASSPCARPPRAPRR